MPRGWFVEHGCTNGCHKACNGWYLGLVVLLSGIWLERAESLATSDSFHGSLFRVLTNFRAVLCVNNSLVCRVRPASSWPLDLLL